MVFINAFEGTDVREKVAHITEFSSALGHLLGMMCDGFGELQSESVEHQQLMTTFVAKIDKHTADIARLHEYNEKQENNKGSHADLMNDLQQFILDFGATSEQLRTELSALRVSTKQELFATQGAIEKLFSEALANMPAPSVSASGGKAIVMTGAPTGDGRSAAPTDTVNHDDALQLLADRLFNLEKKFTVSETNNAKLRLQLDATLQAQDKFDLLTTQIAQQDAQLQAQHDRGRIFEANLLKLKAAQVKNEKSLRDINKKIDYLGSTVQKIIINGQIPMPAPSAAENDEEAAAFDFHFPDTSTLGEDMSVTLETDSIMQDIKTNPTLSRNYLGAGGDPAAHDMIAALEQRIDDVFAPKILRLQDENGDLLSRLAEMAGTVAALEESIRSMQEREDEAKVRRREGRANFVNDDEFYESLASLKTHWVNIFGDIEMKLAQHAKELSDQKEFSEEDLAAIRDMTEFRNLLAENLHAFEAEDTVQATMDKLYPRLDSLNVEANRLFKTDRQLSRAAGDEEVGDEDGILDHIEMSSGRGVSFLKSQSSSFQFTDATDTSPKVLAVKNLSSSPKVESFHRALSRAASEVIPEGDNEEDSLGEAGDGPIAPLVKPSDMTAAQELGPPLTRAESLRRQRSTKIKRKSSSRLDAAEPAPALARQPSALESFTMELANACLSSAPILGERIDKGVLKRRIDRIEDGLANFALLVDLNEEVDHFSQELDGKASVKDFKELRRKKANLADLQTLRDQIFEQMEALRQTVDNAIANGGSAEGGGLGGGGGGSRAVSSDITIRFDKLYNQFQDLVAHCAGFVHRDEVETALQSIVAELKNLKSLAADVDALKKVVGKKAENWEVHRLISILSNGLQEPVLGPAAMHQKCLSCDKPLVNPILQSLQSFGYAVHLKNGGEDEDAPSRAASGSRPSTTGGGPRPQSSNQQDIMSRSVSDAKTLRSAINGTGPLPGSAPSDAAGLPPLSKNRVRLSAGGGAGPSYTFETR